MTNNSTSAHYDLVAEFMRRAGHKTANWATDYPGEKERKLCASLILEEAVEAINALGFEIEVLNDEDQWGFAQEFSVYPNRDEHKIGIESAAAVADGCLDTIHAATATLVMYGIPDRRLQAEIDFNNLQKLAPGHAFNNYGKLIKPPGHVPPDIVGILKDMARSQ